MMGHFGFSYTGMIFVLLLMIPNLIWTKNLPKDYSSDKEDRILLLFERTGEVMAIICVLVFSDYDFHGWNAWCCWLILAILCMFIYELWWIRYFKSDKNLSDFYSNFLGIPVAGATLPVLGFFFLGIYGKVIWMVLATIILGIGHIGIHLEHKKEAANSVLTKKTSE